MRELSVIFLIVISLGGSLLAQSSDLKESKQKDVSMKSQDKDSKPVMVVVNDVVLDLEKNEEGYLVYFKSHAGEYYLKKSNLNFENILKALQESRSLNTKLKVEADAVYLDIQNLKGKKTKK